MFFVTARQNLFGGTGALSSRKTTLSHLPRRSELNPDTFKHIVSSARSGLVRRFGSHQKSAQALATDWAA